MSYISIIFLEMLVNIPFLYNYNTAWHESNVNFMFYYTLSESNPTKLMGKCKMYDV